MSALNEIDCCQYQMVNLHLEVHEYGGALGVKRLQNILEIYVPVIVQYALDLGLTAWETISENKEIVANAIICKDVGSLSAVAATVAIAMLNPEPGISDFDISGWIQNVTKTPEFIIATQEVYDTLNNSKYKFLIAERGHPNDRKLVMTKLQVQLDKAQELADFYENVPTKSSISRLLDANGKTLPSNLQNVIAKRYDENAKYGDSKRNGEYYQNLSNYLQEIVDINKNPNAAKQEMLSIAIDIYKKYNLSP